MTLSDISIRNPVMSWMIMAGLILFGFICFTRMGVDQMPAVTFPVVNVSISLPNASPSIMESDVADPIEDAVLGVEGVNDVQTTCTEGNVSISVYLDVGRSVDSAVQDVQSAVFSAEKQLPTNVYPPVVKKFNSNSSPILWFAVTADPPLTTRDLMLYVRDHLKDRFTSIDGVSSVFLGGWINRAINVTLDNDKLNSRELTVADVTNAIQHQHAEVPAGYFDNQDTQYEIRSMGEAYSVKAFGDLPIIARGGSPNYTPTHLKDVGVVEDGLDEITRISRFNGTPCVGLGVVMQDGYNAVAVANAAKERMQEVLKELPQGFHMKVNFDTTTFIKDNVNELILTIGLSTLLTALVCFFFLGSFSSTLNIFLAIPTSLFGALMVIYFFGFTLNTFTLLALSLSIGVVVDDAIMVLENIVRHQELGEDKVTAALKGARQVTFAAMATSIAIVAIFLPVAFMTGVIGTFFFQFGITITGAVMISLFEAITLTPMRCSQFVEKPDEHNPFNHFISTQFNRLSALYTKVLRSALKNRWKVILAAFLLFFGSLFLTKYVKEEFIPSTDQSVFIVNLKFPVDYSIYHTDRIVKQCEALLQQRQELKNLYVAVGGFGGNASYTAIMFITMKDKGDRPVAEEYASVLNGTVKKGENPSGPKISRRLSQADFMQVCRYLLKPVSKDMKISMQDLSMRGFSTGRGYPVEFLVTGPDWDKLAGYVDQITQAMRADHELTDVDNNFLEGQPEIQVVPDRTKSMLSGVNMDDLGNAIGTLLGGTDLQGTYYHEDGHENNILVRLTQDQRQDPSDINNVYVRNDRGEVLPVSDIASLNQDTTLQQITRDNRARAVFFYASPAPGTTQKQALDEAMGIANKILPADQGYYAELTGTSQSNSSSFGQLGIAMILGIIVAYMVLGSQFNSFVHPIVILLALPFSITGALVALLLSGLSLNLYSMIGLILLLGLVKKNSIMLVDFTNQMRRIKGMDVEKALLTACPIRLRPILMTSFATVAGAIPAALALGPGAELRQPMSVAIIGGILVSTFLTLLVVPCAYSLMSNLESKRHREFVQKMTPKDED